MLGLLVKDLRLLSNQKQFFAVIVLISIFLVMSGQQISFAVIYCTMIAIYFTISTISYDEYNNGYAFLFTMPITRKQYAVEKYLFALVTGGVTWFVTTVAGFFYERMRDDLVASEWFMESASAFFILLIVMCFMLPVQLKFGAEKGRIAVFVFVFAVMAVAMLVQKGFSKMQISMKWMDAFLNMNATGVMLFCGIVFILCVTISILVSIRIVEKKEF